MTTNLRLLLRERPVGRVERRHFEAVRLPVVPPASGEVLVRTCWLAFAPAQRGYLNDVPSYVGPVAIGEVMRATGVGQVVASAHSGFVAGDLVLGSLGWQEYATIAPGDGTAELEILPADIGDPKLALGVLGTTGVTAWVGMRLIGRPVAGDTVLVTAAAGATGSLAGQIARALGAERVVGTASTSEKRAWVCDTAGFDDCIDYRDPKVFRRLRDSAPNGFDVIFDNVGGALLDDALANIRIGARIVLCGSISTGYEPKRPDIGLRNYQFLTTRRARMEGFIVLDHAARIPEARAELRQWIDAGRLRWAEDVVEGLEAAPATLQRLFDGQNLGKQLLHVAGPT
jgi:NADPH-dependent curcumin reductase CurA